MTRTPGIFFALVTIAAAVPSAKAGGTVNIKCAPNEDRVWVYESLVDFNVAAKLKCGDPVQIVERVKGYVKIETANGTEGYVLDTSFPKSALPPAPVEKPNDVESAAAAFAARRGTRAPDNSVEAPAGTHSSAPVAVVSAAAPAVAKPVAASQPAPQPTVTLSAAAVAPAAAAAVAVAPAAVTSASVAPAPVVAAPPPAPPTTAVIAKNSSPAPASIASEPVVVEQPAPAAVSYKAPAPAPAPAPVPAPQPKPVSVATSPAPHANPVVAASTAAPAPAAVAPAKATAVVPVNNPAPAAIASNAPVSVPQPARDDSNNASSMTVETTASLQPVADTTPRAPLVSAAKPPVHRPADPDGDEDSEVAALHSEEANCTQYFSAYGLSANQYKWLAQNRRKAFPGVCPAPSPAQVDFVVIFTHDVPFYNVTMPNAVHTDINGFSDWTPLTTVDTAVISASDADKSHHEYVWVFHTNRGAFNPATFSSHRRPLYSKAETNMLGSRGGFRTVMDALTFIEQNGTNR
jgi:hypothetical protein